MRHFIVLATGLFVFAASGILASRDRSRRPDFHAPPPARQSSLVQAKKDETLQAEGQARLA